VDEFPCPSSFVL
jgi:isopenicillin N synthase-like dioxygenase